MDAKKVKEQVFTWLYRTFCYIVPGGTALYLFLIQNLIDDEVSVMSKVGISGIFVLIIMGIIAIFFYKKYLKNQHDKTVNEILECTDDTKKQELISKKKKIEAKQELFGNACFVAPFVIMWLLCAIIEKGVISLRGTFMTISVSMLMGFGFNGIAQYIRTKK